MKRADVFLLQGGLTSIPKEVLPFKVRYAVGKIINQCRSVTLEADKLQKALYREIGVPNEDKTNVNIPPERWEEFQGRVDQIMEAESGVDLYTIKMSQLAECDGLTAMHLGILAPVTVDDMSEVA